MTPSIKEDMCINGAQLDALKRFFNDLEGKMKVEKTTSDNKLLQNNIFDERYNHTREDLYKKRRVNDIYNSMLN